MAAVHLRHPIHGEKIAYHDLEVVQDKRNGWVVFDPTVKPEPVVEPEPEVVIEKPELEVVTPPPATIPDFLKAPPAPATKQKAPPKTKPEG